VSILSCEGVRLSVDQAGSGPALVLVHGAWSDRSTWDPVFLPLSKRFHVIRYDRRGYGQSQRSGAEPKVHVDDLLALILTLRLSNVILVGNSFGGLVAMRTAREDDRLVRFVVAHEPPLLGMFRDDEHRDPIAERALSALSQTQAAVRDGDHVLAAQLYVEGLASTPGTFRYLPPEIKEGFIANAGSFLADAEDLQNAEFTSESFKRIGRRLLLTHGERTSPFLKLIVERLRNAHPGLAFHAFAAGGHVPHQSCPEAFVAKILEVCGA